MASKVSWLAGFHIELSLTLPRLALLPFLGLRLGLSEKPQIEYSIELWAEQVGSRCHPSYGFGCLKSDTTFWINQVPAFDLNLLIQTPAWQCVSDIFFSNTPLEIPITSAVTVSRCCYFLNLAKRSQISSRLWAPRMLLGISLHEDQVALVFSRLQSLICTI